MEFGDLQGTILRPVLFIMYINSISLLLIREALISYADHTAIFYEGDSWSILEEIMRNDFKTILNFLGEKLLTINREKGFLFSHYSCNLPYHSTLNITDDFIIMIDQSIKYLIIVLDNHLR